MIEKRRKIRSMLDENRTFGIPSRITGNKNEKNGLSYRCYANEDSHSFDQSRG